MGLARNDQTKLLIFQGISWIAGYLEGEAWFGLIHKTRQRPLPCVSVNSTDREPLERLAGLVSGPIHGPYTRTGSLGKKPRYTWRITGQRAQELARDIIDYMSPRRQAQIRPMLVVAVGRFPNPERDPQTGQAVGVTRPNF